MFKLSPERLNELQEEAKARNTKAYRYDRIAKLRAKERRQINKLAALVRADLKNAKKLAERDLEEQKILHEASTDRFPVRPVDPNKIKALLP